jgi:hypothetical protein
VKSSAGKEKGSNRKEKGSNRKEKGSNRKEKGSNRKEDKSVYCREGKDTGYMCRIGEEEGRKGEGR